jgi:hypothetical protein
MLGPSSGEKGQSSIVQFLESIENSPKTLKKEATT